MFGIGFGEFLIIALVILFAVGPGKMPTFMKAVGDTFTIEIDYKLEVDGVALKEAIRRGMTAEAAVERVQNDTRARMLRQADSYWRERLKDLDALSDRLLRILSGSLRTNGAITAHLSSSSRARMGALPRLRKVLPRSWLTATPPTFAVDDVTREVCDLVTAKFADHPGTLRPEHLPATHDDAEAQWRWALRECLPMFGPFEDAMSVRSSGLFHSRISPLLNLHRLLPARVVRDVANGSLPLPSRDEVHVIR